MIKGTRLVSLQVAMIMDLDQTARILVCEL
jgi:hypothetical protein